ncbi:MAG: ribonuclease H family protein [Bacteroidales bacterium]|nr:ribonuclease H family protein [Bacteroidales bacterium]
MAKKKYYVVWDGKQTGVFASWKECEQQIKGFEGAKYKSFPNKELAEKAFQGNYFDFVGKDFSKKEIPKEVRILIGNPIQNSLSVDAACSGNPGVLEYRGVDTKSGIELFRLGPFPHGTVNIGEFLALVHGLAYLKQKNSKFPVYSDSKIAIKWVKQKKINTKLERKQINRNLFQLVDRAIKWLQNNSYETEILKWETAAWGEIPADFGRK